MKNSAPISNLIIGFLNYFCLFIFFIIIIFYFALGFLAQEILMRAGIYVEAGIWGPFIGAIVGFIVASFTVGFLILLIDMRRILMEIKNSGQIR